MNTYTVRPNFYSCLLKLQGIKHDRYSWADIGRKLGITRQAAQKLFMNEATDDSFVKYGTLASLINFFTNEGMPVTPNDLFVITEGSPDEPH